VFRVHGYSSELVGDFKRVHDSVDDNIRSLLKSLILMVNDRNLWDNLVRSLLPRASC